MYTIENHEKNLIKENRIIYGSKVSQDSLLIMHHYDLTYQAKIIGQNTITYAKEDPLDIIKTNCLDNLTSYDGQREAIYQTFNYKQKVPIPLLLENIIMIPSKAPKDIDCHWLNYDKVVKLNKDGSGTQIIFDNDLSLTIPESYRTIRQQYKRAQTIKQYIEAHRKTDFFVI